MKDPFQVVRDFEAALCEYTGAPYAVTTTSCTMALLLAVAWNLHGQHGRTTALVKPGGLGDEVPEVEIPKRTYVSVPMSIIHAGGWPAFRDEDWRGWYDLRSLNVMDSARWFTSGLFNKTAINHLAVRMVCVSFHWSKTLSIGQGGAILLDDTDAYNWLRKARFDGRSEGEAPIDQAQTLTGFDVLGWHCYLSPRDAAEGLTRLRLLPKHNEPLPNDEYPNLAEMEIFK